MIEEVNEMETVRRLNDSPARADATWLLLLCVLMSPTAFAQHRQTHDQHSADAARREARERLASSRKGPGVIEIGPARVEIPDVEVLDQDGKKVRFYSDLIKDKVVVLNFFFTSCTFVCLPQGRSLAKLKASLAKRFAKEVFFVSVSRDPETDTPRKLKRWGSEFGAGDGWTLVTGEKDVMTRLVADFTGEGLGTQMHSAIIFIGNDRTGAWMEAEGLAPAAELVKAIDSVAGPASATQR
jgi:cytochrome oxidase Cu insertion factor (SCO1/SenC/PrrC family)